MVAEETVRSFLRAQIEKAAAEDFRTLRQIPSTHTWKVIDYVSELRPTEQRLLFDAFTEKALFLFFPDRNPELLPAKTGDASFQRFLEAMPLRSDWKYLGVRALRQLLADSRSAKPIGISLGVPESVLAHAAAIVPTTAPKIRSALKQSLSDRFQLIDITNLGGGDWTYECIARNRRFMLHADFGGRSDQIRYWISYADPESGVNPVRLTYEGVLGMGFGWWDYVSASNLATTVTILCNLIEELVAIPLRWRS